MCDGDCKCDEKKKNPIYDKLAELSRFMGDHITRDDNGNTLLPQPLVYDTTLEKATKLQFCGWAISLNSDGTWYVEDTSGG